MKHLFTLLVMMMLFLADGYCQISIIGPASPSGNWTADHDLTESSPGVWTGTFTLNAGELKFRQNHDWANNWGSASFPSGTGVLNGASIPVSPAGVYSITFNASTLLYSFQIRGRVGVNNTDPQAGLDIDGGLRTRTQVEGVNNTTNSVFIPLERSFVWIEGGTAPFSISVDVEYADGSRLVLFNGTSHDATFGMVTIPSNKAMEFIKLDGDFRALGASAGGSDGWSTLGNSGSNPLTDFIGTTDNQPLVFKTNNTKRMQIETSNDVNELKFETDLEKKNRISFENSGDISGDPFGVKINMETVSDPIFFHGINFSSQSNDYPDFNKQNILHIGADGNVGVGGKDPYGKMTIGHRAIGPYPTLTLIDSSQTNEGGSILKFRKFDAFSDFSIRSHLGADYEADQSSLRFAWSGYNLLNLRGDGRLGLYNIGNNSGLELGYNHSSKSTDAGKIQYGGFGGNDHVLNIVGGGTDPSGNDRKVKIWAEGGTEVNGILGVGTNNPTEILDVNGNIKTSGEIKPNGTEGMANQVLTSKGDGSMEWKYLPNNTNIGYGSWSPENSIDGYQPVFDSQTTDLGNFGTSVALSGDNALISSPLLRDGNGSVFYYKRINGLWQQIQKIDNPVASSLSRFGFDIDIDQNFAVIGKEFPVGTGNVYIYKLNSVTSLWELHTTLTSPTVSIQYGSSVAISGELIVVGDKSFDEYKGKVYVYRYDSTNDTWSLAEEIQDNEPNSEDKFGTSVDVYNERIIVGANNDREVFGDPRTGSASIFFYDFNTNNAELVDKSYPDHPRSELDEYGWSVSISGDYALVGNPTRTVGTHQNAGMAQLLKKSESSNNYLEVNFFYNSPINTDNFFGSRLDLNGNYIILGTPSDDFTNWESGSAEIYVLHPFNRWSSVNKFKNKASQEHDRFGTSVSLDNLGSGNFLIGGRYIESNRGMSFFGYVK